MLHRVLVLALVAAVSVASAASSPSPFSFTDLEDDGDALTSRQNTAVEEESTQLRSSDKSFKCTNKGGKAICPQDKDTHLGRPVKTPPPGSLGDPTRPGRPGKPGKPNRPGNPMIRPGIQGQSGIGGKNGRPNKRRPKKKKKNMRLRAANH